MNGRRDLVIKKQRKSLEKVTGALGDNQSQQYQKDAHKCEGTQKTENGDKGPFITEEIDELPASNNAQSSSGPSTVRKVFQFVRHVGFYVGYTIDLLIPQYSRNSSVTLSEKEYLEVGTLWKLVQVVCRPRKKVFSSNNEAPSFIYRMGVS
ncbi:hypothetical protein P5673_029824 [Acropora cervicornis]|uniref:Uncharacterized protein n=1 Tax=Acropora cervicornis TaxID=6130 RepID=A0AAD9PV92_ACRCE|nr:hypothetical protein P5673_029824 [Acropora cervicornis]